MVCQICTGKTQGLPPDKFLDVKQDILSVSALLVLWGIYWILQIRLWQFAQLLWATTAHSKMSRDVKWTSSTRALLEIFFQVGGRWRFSSKRLKRSIMIILQVVSWSSNQWMLKGKEHRNNSSVFCPSEYDCQEENWNWFLGISITWRSCFTKPFMAAMRSIQGLQDYTSQRQQISRNHIQLAEELQINSL